MKIETREETEKEIREKLNQIVETIESNQPREELYKLWGEFITHLSYFNGYFGKRIYLCMKLNEIEKKLKFTFEKDDSLPEIHK